MWRFRLPILLFVLSRVLLLVFQAYTLPASARAIDMPWTEPWLRWDAIYYTSLAQDGYTLAIETHSTAAFFPLYPALIRLFTPLVGSVGTAALLVSNTALLGVFIMLQVLADREGLTKGAQARAMAFLFLYPMGFFLSAGYAESLFLFLTLGSAYAARTSRWTWAIALAMFATLTRITGVLMVGVIALEWAATHGFTLSKIRQREAWAALGRGWRAEGWVLLAALGVPLALLSFMVYMGLNFGSMTAFIEAHNSVRGESSLMRLIEDIIKVLTLQTRRFDIISGVGAFALALVMLPVVFRLRGSYGWYFLLSAIIPLSTGLISYMRLLGGVFPLYLVLGQVKPSPLGVAGIYGSMLLLQFFTLTVYFSGGFVA